ncbi:MAG: hypothetical protein AB7K35_01380 [Pseudorhodoplanes sp.]
MATSDSAAAAQHMPWFITAEGGTDGLFVFTTILVLVSVLLLGVIFLWLHSLPERLGHKKLQFEIVAVLGLISLFTHMHIFWIIGLVLALIDLPDFRTPLERIAGSLEKLSGTPPPAEPEINRPFVARQPTEKAG